MDSEDTKRRFEILKMAQERLTAEYTFKRATDHNRWLAESSEVWIKHQKTLPHPAFAPYPTEIDILNAATALFNFVYGTTAAAREEPIIEKEPTIMQEPTKPIPEGDLVFPPKEDEPEVTIPDISTEATLSKTLLPGWMRRSK
jgi:hypothetical protein